MQVLDGKTNLTSVSSDSWHQQNNALKGAYRVISHIWEEK